MNRLVRQVRCRMYTASTAVTGSRASKIIFSTAEHAVLHATTLKPSQIHRSHCMKYSISWLYSLPDCVLAAPDVVGGASDIPPAAIEFITTANRRCMWPQVQRFIQELLKMG